MNTENHYQETDLGNISLNPRGEYNPEESYEYLDLVVLEGGSYVCLAENGATITGISPESGKTTQYWQVITIPGSLTPEYIAMHDRVVNLSEQVEADAEEVRTAEQNVSGMELNVTQMQEQTRQSAEAAEQSKDSSAGYAASANASRQAAEESEQNINAHITGFDNHVAEKTEEAENDIEAARIAANKAIIAQQEQSVNEVARAGIEAISTAQSAAQTATEKAQAADTSEKNAAASETAAKLSETNATKMAEQVATDKEQVAYDRTAVENAKQEMTGSVAQIEQNTQGISELKGDLDDILIHDDNTNFIDKRKMALGYINAEGGVNDSTSFYHTDYIELEENVPYNWAYLSTIYYAFYDDAKNVLSTYSTLGNLQNNFTIPSGAKYGRFSLKADRISLGYFISTHGGTIPDYAEIIDDNKIKGLTTANERINAVEKSIAEIKLNAFGEIKDRLSFGIGQIDDNGQFIPYSYRISSNKNERFDYAISVKMNDGFSCGFVTFDSIEQETRDFWSGWVTECIIPANTIFKIQAKCDTTIEAITDVHDNVIYKAMHIRALSDSDLMVKELTEDATFDFSNPLKIVRVATDKWTQGACTVGNKYVGFDASNDDHTNTGYAKIGTFDDFSTHDRITHNLGHCASADYDDFTDTMLVANGTTASGVIPSLFLIKNATSIVENKTNIVYGSDGVVEIPFDGIDGEGIIACFGENSNIMYVVSAESASLYYQKGEKYIYRVVLGMGTNNLNTLFDSNNYGTYIENCSDDEFNGTAHIIERYTTNWLGELQGLKYINGKLVVSTDLKLNGIGTGFLTVIKLSNGKAMIEKNKWIPCINEKAERVNVETEGVLFNGSDGYVAAISKFSTGNVYAVYRFNLCEL